MYVHSRVRVELNYYTYLFSILNVPTCTSMIIKRSFKPVLVYDNESLIK